MALDPDRDGRLTRPELWAVVERVFAKVDTDGDREISPAEYTPIETRVAAALRLQHQARCALPSVSAGALVIALSTYDAEALSLVAVGGLDQETNALDISIEPGPEPLYIVATSHSSMIWRVSGATERVARFAISAYETDPAGISASGAVGLPADKVTVLKAGCLGYFNEQREIDPVAQAIWRGAGRQIDAAITNKRPRSIAVPSGQVEQPDRRNAPEVPDGFDATTWRAVTRFWSAGLVAIDPREVVAASSVEPYVVLPSQAGISQLIGSGALQWVPPTQLYRIVKPIPRLPPGMGGGHSVNFILEPGIPTPPGDPVHSCLMDAQGTPLAGTRCPGPPLPAEFIESLQRSAR